MRKLLSFLFLGLLAAPTFAQVFIQNTLYNHTRMLYNPANTGFSQASSINGTNLTLLGRLQWVGIEGAPQSSAVIVNASSERLGGGIGGYVLADQLGPFSRIGANVAYAYHLSLGTEGQFGTLSIGASAGILQQTINGEWQYDPSNGPDPVVPVAPISGVVPSLAAGITYRGFNDRLFVGISGQDLLEPSIEKLLISNADGIESRIPRSFYLNAGYRFALNEESNLTPTLFLRTDGLLPPQLDLSLNWDYKSIVFGGSYRFFNDSFSALMGFNVNDRTFLAYAYDYTLNALNATGDVGSHEIIISYTIPSKSGSPTKINRVLDDPTPGSF